MKIIDKQKPIDVLFISEGTYPYVRGGVASWIHEIITAMEDKKFGVIFLGSKEDDYNGIQYRFPENLVYLESYFMFSGREYPPAAYISGSDKVKKIDAFLNDEGNIVEELLNIYFYLSDVTLADILYGKKTFDMIEDLYVQKELNVPFIDFFWTLRNIFIPLWIVVKAILSVLDREISLIHSPSTGYAGFLGALLKKTRDIPYIVTEHGIYTLERKIDLLNTHWIPKDSNPVFRSIEVEELKKLWINFFINLGKICYKQANKVICLFEGAKSIQMSLGCSPEKIDVIPNGVKIEQYALLRQQRDSIPPVIALMGRVTPVKDVKTFIKAMKILIEKMPEAEGWIVGPEAEDPDYAKECKMLVNTLRLEDKVKFLGFQKLTDILPYIGLSTLTSISEGMPLVVLESFATGVPCVATDAGSIKQLVYGGLNDDDIQLGKAGEIVSAGDSRAFADAYYKFLTDKQLYTNAQFTAIQRVERFYSFDTFINRYQKIYETFIGVNSWQEYQSS
ncbi:MAG TPA: GT4 family glycosyltransferase PelF [Thermodesulfovibrio thiophilus]|nr:GT4 family glycosyltransferase PelF [Thermodesulfovibrio thiophilus]